MGLDLPIAHIAYGYANGRSHPTFNGGCLLTTGTAMNKGHFVSNNKASAFFHRDAHTDGNTLHIPGKGMSGFQTSPGAGLSDPKSDWVSGGRGVDYQGRCAEIAIAPDGTKYKFGLHTFRRAKTMRVPAYWQSSGYQLATAGYSHLSLPRRYAVMLITEVEDIHGNWVQYEYSNGLEPRLTHIKSNDGRLISLTYYPHDTNYNSRLIKTITANGRQWHYQYKGLSLKKVILPDGRYWEFGVGDDTDQRSPMLAMALEPVAHYRCKPNQGALAIKHPDGALGEFTLKEEAHLKATVDTDMGESHLRTGPAYRYGSRGSLNYAGAYETDDYLCRNGQYKIGHEPPEGDPSYRIMSLVEKKITAPDTMPATWTFQYTGEPGTPLTHSQTTITQPDGTLKIYKHHTFGTDHGLLESIETKNGNNVIEKVLYEYDVSQPLPRFCTAGGEFGDVTGTCYNSVKRPIKKRTLFRDGVTYITESEFDTTSGIFNDAGRPNKITRYSTINVNRKRITELGYWHNPQYNLVGLLDTVTRNGKVFSHYDFTDTGLLEKVHRFNTLWSSLTYHPDGNVKTITDALGFTASLSEYKRGKAQYIKRRDGTELSSVIDDNGWLINEKNALGASFNYQYTQMGWITEVDRSEPWSNTKITYHNVGKSNFYSREVRGKKETNVYYDAFLRPTLVRTRPLQNGGVTTYIKTQYDALGRVIFSSFPATSSTAEQGTTTRYDGLGRVIEKRENVSPFSTTTTDYLSFNKHKVTDPNGNETITYRSGFGSPFDGHVTTILSPEDIVTTMSRDIYGNLTALTQFHDYDDQISTQRWYYDTRFNVCKHFVPETGSKLIAYDAANQVIAYKEGQSQGASCTSSLSSSERVNISYDPLGRQTLIDYPNGTPDIEKTFDDSGNPLTVNRGGINWTYTYDNMSHLKSETLEVDNRQYALAYDYNSDGVLVKRILPSGTVLTHTLNGLNQTLSISTPSIEHATNMQYSVRGALSQITFANNTTTYNRYLPQGPLKVMWVEDEDGDLWADYLYQYDANLNLIESSYDNERTMTYDGMNRLKTATGQWGDGRYYYDALGNLTRKKLGAATVTNYYNADKNRISGSYDTRSGYRAFKYDLKGNVKQAGNLSFNYDAANQPVSMTGAIVGAYRYDGHLRRVKSTVNGKIIYNVFDSSGKLIVVDKIHDNKKTEYIHNGSSAIAHVTGVNTVYLYKDSLGSAFMGLDKNRRVTFSEFFTPFGERVSSRGVTEDLAGFTGHIRDKETGLSYMQARYYDPVIGRFYSNDPVDTVSHLSNEEGIKGFNRYSYAVNNPYKYTDPDGRLVIAVGGQTNANAGLSGAAASGGWVNISTKGVSWGTYQSAEAGSAVATPSAGAGFEASVLFTSDTDAALSGMYMVNGADAAVASADLVTTLPSPGGESVVGVQISGDVVGTQSDVGVHNRTGVGTYQTSGEKSWGQIASDAVDKVVEVATELLDD